MADKSKNQIHSVDEAGIRLAPAPMQGENTVTMPSVTQQFVIAPELHVDAPKEETQRSVSTEHDFQPKKTDVSKKWKRRRRSKNIALGIVMFIVSAVVLLQYVLGALDGVADKLSSSRFVFIPIELGAINNLVEAIKLSIEEGWTSPIAKEVWLHMIPSLMLTVGLLAVFVNLLKSITGLFGAIKPRKYVLSAVIYLLTVLAVLIMFLVGAPKIGVDKLDFITDIIKGYKTSEIFGITVFALGYLVVSVICSWISSEKYGYLK